MTRMLLGILAVALLLGGGVMLLTSPEGGVGLTVSGGCIRMGLVVGALWLAYPQIISFLSTTPKWLLTVSAIGVVFVVVNPKLLLFVIPAVLGLWFFGSRLATRADSTIIGRRTRRKRSEPGDSSLV